MGCRAQTPFRKGFVYSDARVDDARLAVFNVMDAHLRGADVRVRTRLVTARPRPRCRRAFLAGDARRVRRTRPPEVTAKALVNVAGPWVKRVRDAINGAVSKENVRHVKGSHIVVPRVHAGEHAYILQNADKRIVFVIPYQDRYTLIGTTDVPVEAFEEPEISSAEIDYLLELANTYLAQPLTTSATSCGRSAASGRSTTTAGGSLGDHARLRVQARHRRCGGAAAVSVYGGKITTYRKLAEHVLG